MIKDIDTFSSMIAIVVIGIFLTASTASTLAQSNDSYTPPPNNAYLQTLTEIGESASKSAAANLGSTTTAMDRCIDFVYALDTEIIAKCVTLISKWNHTIVCFNVNNSEVLSEILTSSL